MSFTQEQSDAIYSNGNTIISAGAGSGKTAVLTQKVIELVKKGLGIDKMLILTFTEFAAQEMVTRIRAALIKESKNNKEIEKQIIKLPNAYISTFDSFYRRLIKEEGISLGLPSIATLLEEDIEELLITRYLEDEINEYIKHDKEFIEFLISYNLNKIDDFKKNLLRLIKEINSSMNSQNILLDIKNCKPLFVYKIINNVLVKLNDYKKNNSAYTFSDCQKFAYKILQNKTDYKDHFKQIIVDEYQDTNDEQNEILKLLCNDNMFLVGDIKQSIYRFRGANPQGFLERFKSIDKKDGANFFGEGNFGKRITLSNNFRSSPAVINTVNSIFTGIMTKSDVKTSIDYLAKEDKHIMVSANEIYKKVDIPKTQILEYKYLHPNTVSFDGYNGLNAEEQIKVEALIIAEDISKRIKREDKILEKDGSQRAVRGSDFCILTKDAIKLNKFKKYLLQFFNPELNIGVSLQCRKEIKHSDEIIIIVNSLKLIKCIREDDYSNIAKHCFMSLGRSYVFAMEDKELYRIITSKNFREEFLSLEIGKELKSIAEEANILPITLVLQRLYDLYNIQTSVKSIRYPFDAKTAFDYIYYQTESFENIDSSLDNFIEFLESKREKEYKIDIYESDLNSVRLMNIHKSKGLEFLICYFPQLNKGNSNKSKGSTELISLIENKGKYKLFTPTINNSTRLWKYSSEVLQDFDNKREEENEELKRLFYVALTRAREQIILLYPNKILKSENKKNEQNDDVDDKFSDYIKKYIDGEKDYNDKDKTFDLIDCTDYVDRVKDGKVDCFVKDNNIVNNNENIIEPLKSDKNLSYYKKRASKDLEDEIDDSLKEKLLKGIELHREIETGMNTKLFEHKEFKGKRDKCIFEYEFLSDDGVLGSIDMLLVDDNRVAIVDFKTSNIDDESYLSQLKVYEDYIQGITGCDNIEKYLYSIVKDELKRVETTKR